MTQQGEKKQKKRRIYLLEVGRKHSAVESFMFDCKFLFLRQLCDRNYPVCVSSQFLPFHRTRHGVNIKRVFSLLRHQIKGGASWEMKKVNLFETLFRTENEHARQSDPIRRNLLTKKS